MDIVLATNNAHKVTEIREKLAPLGIQVFSLRDKEIEIEIEESGVTFRENAAIKSETVFKLTGMPALGDDSGLMVDALDGRPGVYSARFAGDGADDSANIDKLLLELADAADDERSAAFHCCMALTTEEGTRFFEGRCSGEIIDERCGTYGFGYDPVFFLPQFGKTMAELPLGEKNKISHRARALEAFVEYVSEVL